MPALDGVKRYLGESRDEPACDMPVLARPLGEANEDDDEVVVELLDVAGRLVRQERIDPANMAELLPQQQEVLGKAWGQTRGMGESLLALLAADDGAMQCAIDTLNGDSRYDSDAWFERDNRQVTLTDRVTGKTVVSLVGEDYDQAVEDGFLSPPRHPRPGDSDWLQPLLDYAREQGLLQEVSATNRPAKAPRP